MTAWTDVRAERRGVAVDAFTHAGDFRRYFASRYGPTVAVDASISDDAERADALDAALDGLAASAGEGEGPMEWEYLLFTATRR